jgi:hypothetical protein
LISDSESANRAVSARMTSNSRAMAVMEPPPVSEAASVSATDRFGIAYGRPSRIRPIAMAKSSKRETMVRTLESRMMVRRASGTRTIKASNPGSPPVVRSTRRLVPFGSVSSLVFQPYAVMTLRTAKRRAFDCSLTSVSPYSARSKA